MEASGSTRRISLAELANTFVPFGVLVAAALLAAEGTQNLVLHRTIYTVWATVVLLTPAFCLYVLQPPSGPSNTWRLFWTFSYIAYLVHFYYAVFVTFGGSIGRVYAEQGAFIATVNFLLTLSWGVDVVLTWVVRGEPRWLRIERLVVNVYTFIMFVVATIALKGGVIRWLGILMTLSVLCSVVARFWRAWAARVAASEGAPAKT